MHCSYQLVSDLLCWRGLLDQALLLYIISYILAYDRDVKLY